MVGLEGRIGAPLQSFTTGGTGNVAKAGQETTAEPLDGTTNAGTVPGTVVTDDSGLVWLALLLHTQRVLIVWAGPVCTYVGKVVLQPPPFNWYWRVEPTGQLVLGTAMLPPPITHPVWQTLFVTCTTGAADVNTGQPGQTPGTVVTVLVGLDVFALASHVQRVNIVCAGPS